MGLARDRDVTKAKAQEINVPYVDLSRQKPEDSAVNIIPEHLARRHNVLPFKKDSGTNTLYVAMSDINNITAADDLRLVSRCNIKPVLAAPRDIEDAVTRI